MIIFGTQGITSTVLSQAFHCPTCRMSRNGALKKVSGFFTLYFIPLIPIGERGRYVECDHCGGTFAEEILAFDPEQSRQELNASLLRVMILAALADGEIDPTEHAEIKRIYEEITGFPIPDASIEKEASMATEANATLTRFAATMQNMDAEVKAIVIKLAYQVMSVGGNLRPGHQRELDNMGDALGVPRDQYDEFLRNLQAAPSRITY